MQRLISSLIQSGRRNFAPGIRGALFYGTYWLAIAAFDPFLNVYFNRLGLSGLQIGWLSMLSPLFIMLIPPFVSHIADKYAIRVRLLIISILTVAGTIMLYSFPRTFYGFLPTVILVSALRSSIGPLSDSLIARMASKYRVDFGNMRLGGSIAYAVASLLLGFFWSLVGFGYMFVVSGLLLIPQCNKCSVVG